MSIRNFFATVASRPRVNMQILITMTLLNINQSMLGQVLQRSPLDRLPIDAPFSRRLGVSHIDDGHLARPRRPGPAGELLDQRLEHLRL